MTESGDAAGAAPAEPNLLSEEISTQMYDGKRTSQKRGPEVKKTMKIHVKKGDMVQVITGKDTGKKGKILDVDTDKGRVVVEGANMIKKHRKPTQTSPQGGILEKEGTIASSNVLLYCNKCKAPVRHGKQIKSDGTKVRVCKKCGEAFDK